MASNERALPDYRTIPNNTKEWWFMDPALRLNMLHCIGLCGTLFFAGYDGSLVNGLQSIEEWQSYFGHPDANTLGLMTSAGFLPGLIASFVADFIGFYIGRRWTLWLGTGIMSAGAVVMSTATSMAVFCGGRAILGFGTYIAMTIAPTQLQEIAHPRYRGPVGAFFTCTNYIAAVLSAGICLGCLDIKSDLAWRLPCWFQLIGPLATVLMTCTMPESPRWLVKKDQLEKARQILVKYHANGKEDDELVEYEFREICAALHDEDSQPQIGYLDFFRTPGNRHRLLILVVVGISTNWVGNGIISYYFSPILNSLGLTNTYLQLEILLCLQIWNLIVSTTAAVYIDKIGRRKLWLIATFGQGVCMAIVMGLSAGYVEYGVKSAGAAVIPFLFIFDAAYDIAYTPMSYSYPIEILTFSMRTKGSAIYIVFVTAALAANNWVNPVALDALEWRYYGVFIAVNAVLFIIQYFKFPETKNLTIEETAILFDGDSIMAHMHDNRGKLTSTLVEEDNTVP